MLVSPKHKKIVLNLKQPANVLNAIHGSKILKYKGRDLTVVPHSLDAVRRLRSLGIKAPGPLRYHYKFSGSRSPFEHQVETSDFLAVNKRALCLNDMGTGKTLSVLWAFDFLRNSGAVTGAILVVGPLSTLERTWSDEVFANFPHLNVAVLHGSLTRRMKLLDSRADVFVINHDGIKSKAMMNLLREMLVEGRIQILAIDELATFRNARTDRWKDMNKLAIAAEYVWGLTGTPMPNEPTDVWAQVKLVRPDKVPRLYTDFRDMVMKQAGPYKWQVRDAALDVVHAAMQPAIRYKREDCIDLPPTTYITRECEMSGEQQKLFVEMTRRLKAEYEGGEINAINEASKRQKLRQIACGAAYGSDGSVVIPAGPRLALVEELIEQCDFKVIVFVPFVAALTMVAMHVSQRWPTAMIYGDVPKRERDTIFGAFQRADSPRVIVAQPSAMSHGLTLTKASLIIWYAPIDSSEVYHQACARIIRPGQVNSTVIAHIESNLLEREMYARNQRRQSNQGVLLDLFGAGIDLLA